MPRKKKTTANQVTDRIKEPEVVNPGDCCGNYLATDESCMICEIAETCKEMTEAFNSKGGK